MTETTLAIAYLPDPLKSRALFNAQMFFGIPDLDPEITANQTLVKAIQEDGTLVNLSQPVLTNSGGVPVLNGDVIRLNIDGDYSFTANDRLGAQKYHFDRVDNPASGSVGFSGIVVTEEVTLTAVQTTVVLTTLDANSSVIYIQTSVGDQGFLAKGIDYTVTNPTTVELSQTYNAGDKLIFRQNDPTGQLVSTTSAPSLRVYVDLAAAQAAAVSGDIVDGTVFTLNGNPTEGDGLGGDKYEAIVTAFSNDGVNFLDLNTTLQAALQTNYYRLKNYSETIATAIITAGVLNIDLNNATVQEITLTESASSVTFLNFNPLAGFASTVTLKVTQNAVGGFGITWPASIVWAGGVAPTVTVTALAEDIFGFTTFDGVTFYGFTLGQNFS